MISETRKISVPTDPHAAPQIELTRSAEQGQRISLIIASKGRPHDLGRWIDHVGRQTLKPHQIIFSVTTAEDLPAHIVDDTPDGVEISYGSPGLCAQRNRGLNKCRSDTDIIAFFDDDYVPTANCFEQIARLFAAQPEMAGVTGRLLADGIHAESISDEDALSMIETFEASSEAESPLTFRPHEHIYGCNMVYRYQLVHQLRFDENLPLYAWQEDVDFANRVRKLGLVGRSDAFVGVHQGVKGGRTSGRRLGYSQIANPIYLYRKGTMTRDHVLYLISRNLVSNHLRSFRPEPLVDRRGRVVGNWLAIWHLVARKLHPLNVLKF
jgi:glycosyltransferase involved in cell wall biosynthesis